MNYSVEHEITQASYRILLFIMSELKIKPAQPLTCDSKTTPLKSYLTYVILLCALPLLVLTVYLGANQALISNESIDEKSIDTARNVASLMDIELGGKIRVLEMLADSSNADRISKREEFKEEASFFRRMFGSHIILADLSGQVVFMTGTHSGEPLTGLIQPEKISGFETALKTGKTAVGEVFQGNMSNQPIIAIAAPVVRDDVIRGVLVNLVQTSQLQQSLDQMALPEKLTVSVLDQSEKVIARKQGAKSQTSEVEEGQRRYVSRLKAAPWSVAVDVPRSVYSHTLLSGGTVIFMAICVTALAIGLGASRSARRIANSVTELVEQSPSSNCGGGFTEIKAVGTRLSDTNRARDAAIEESNKSNQRNQLAQDAAQAATWEWFPLANRTVWSEQLWPLLGLEPHSCEQSWKSLIESMHPDDRARVDKVFQEAAAGRTEINAEWRVNEIDGKNRWLLCRGRLLRDEEGELSCFTGMIIDITDIKLAELESQRSELMLRSILDQMPSGVTVRDAQDGTLLLHNRRSKEILGTLYETFEEVPVHHGLHPDGRPYRKMEWPIYRSMSRGDHVNSEEIEFHREDGSIVYLSANSAPVMDADGRIGMAVGVFHDVTEARLAQEALRQNLENLEKQIRERTRQVMESHKLLSAIINNLPVAVSYVDSNERFVFSNKTFQTWWAQSPAEITGQDVQKVFAGHLESPLAQIKIGLEGQSETRELTHTFGDEITRDVWTRIVPDIGEDGVVRGVIRFAIDITMLKKVERELRESEKKYRELSELLPQGVWEMDLNGNFTFVNTAFAELVGFEKQDLLSGIKPTDLVIDEERQQVNDSLKSVVDKKKLAVNQRTILKKDGTTVPCLIYSSPICENDCVNGIRGITVDVGPLKRAEEEQEQLKQQLFETGKLASLGTLVGGLAHDFNNMLQVIIGYTEILMDGVNPGHSDYKAFKHILETSTEGAELVTKLLTFGQQAQVYPKPMDINAELREMVKFVARALPRIVCIETKLMDEPAMISADRNQISQLLLNLAINASEAMPEGGSLRISTRKVLVDKDHGKTLGDLKPGNYIILTVSDTGHGIQSDILPKIFDPFFTTKPRGSARGTGLGLSVVRGIVQQQGGFISCSSKPGIGTEFHIYFNAIEAPELSAPARSFAPKSPRNETILIVEDSAAIASMEKVFFENEGYTVMVAADGQQALDIFRTNKDSISLVIMDLIMPVMSGKECLMEMLKIDPSVKALIVSGYTPEDELGKEVMPYAKGFVRKPCRKEELLRVARQAIDS